MDFVIALFLAVFRGIGGRYLLPFIFVTVALTFGVATIASLAGGSFWLAAKYAAEGCGIIALLAAVGITISAIRNGF